MVINYRYWLYDKARIILSLNPSRLFNLLRILLSWQISVFSGRSFVWGYPFSISYETSAICNLKCPECSVGLKKTIRSKHMGNSVFLSELLLQFKREAFYCNLYFQGEPFLNRDIFKMIKNADDNGYYTVIATNGHFLNEPYSRQIISSGLNRIIISLDGISEESYSNYRKSGDFKSVTEGIRELCRIRKESGRSLPLVEVQFLVNKKNEHQMKKAPDFVKELGADILTFKSMQIISEEGVGHFLPVERKYNRYFNTKTFRKSCFRLWSHAVFTSDGKLVPCCYDKIPEFAVTALVSDQKLLWKSSEMMDFRNRKVKNRNVPVICYNCVG
jgi:MoaA/NifB/PqqE/SkfB family radical SAM enzyme